MAVSVRMIAASSNEGQNYALVLQEVFEDLAETIVLEKGVLEMNHLELEGLMNSLDDFDFGAFLLTESDFKKMDNVQEFRDKLVFCLGMFLGKLGASRVAFFLPQGVKSKLESENMSLIKIPVPQVNESTNFKREFDKATSPLRRQMIKVGSLKHNFVPIASLSKMDSEYNIIAILSNWIESALQEHSFISVNLSYIDQTLGLKKGMTKAYFEVAAGHCNFNVKVLYKSENIIRFRKENSNTSSFFI